MTHTEFLLTRIAERENRCRTHHETQRLSPAVPQGAQPLPLGLKATQRNVDVQAGYFPGDEGGPDWEPIAGRTPPLRALNRQRPTLQTALTCGKGRAKHAPPWRLGTGGPIVN